MTTKLYSDGVKHSGWQAFDGRLWQRNYHEHVIRNEVSYLKITHYIQTNPLKWQNDRHHVSAMQN
jgi:putative transposase